MLEKERQKMIAAGVKQLRGYIRGELKTKGEASLVFVMGKFDFHEHAIPSLDEFNAAMSQFTGALAREEADIVLRESPDATTVPPLEQPDIDFLYNAYLKRMKEKA